MLTAWGQKHNRVQVLAVATDARRGVHWPLNCHKLTRLLHSCSRLKPFRYFIGCINRIGLPGTLYGNDNKEPTHGVGN